MSPDAEPERFRARQTALLATVDAAEPLVGHCLFVSDGHRWRRHLEFPLLG
jgi:hypothetical protein